jgi:Mn-containing catalase
MPYGLEALPEAIQHGPSEFKLPKPGCRIEQRGIRMYLHTQLLINEIAADEPDPAAANALQEGLGGQFGEMRTMMQYLFQSINFRGDPSSKPYKDLLQGIGTEEISHVELIGTTISQLLDGSPRYQGNPLMNRGQRAPHR